MLVDFGVVTATKEIATQVAGCSVEWNDSEVIHDSSTSLRCAALQDGWELLVALEEDEKNDGLRRALNTHLLVLPQIDSLSMESSIPESRGNHAARTIGAKENSGVVQKTYNITRPSRFCHICGRKPRESTSASCGRLLLKHCRKVVCARCLMKYYSKQSYSENAPVGEAPRLSWECPHCKRICPDTAQCNVYGRSNYQRHLALHRLRSKKSSL